MDTLIIVAPLIEPPSESLSVRHLTLVAKIDLSLDVILEVDPHLKDLYWSFGRPRGLFDAISQFVTPQEREEGIRIDLKPNYPLSIITDRITHVNYHNLMRQLRFLRLMSTF